ncbi:hypothetical protein C0989_005057 [Termitomyces sp. Mn162]|nr:hypothetical protein C0989_005057 [Termitomyces sp. Mn162]
MGEVLRAALAQAEELFSVDPSTSAAPTEEGSSLSVALATTNPNPAMSSGTSLQDNLTEESMELDYANNSLAPMNPNQQQLHRLSPAPQMQL